MNYQRLKTIYVTRSIIHNWVSIIYIAHYPIILCSSQLSLLGTGALSATGISLPAVSLTLTTLAGGVPSLLTPVLTVT